MLLAVCFTVSGCGSSKEPANLDSQTQTSSTAAMPSSAKKSVDPATVAVLKGRVIFTGQAPAPKNISVRGNPECATFHKEGSIPSEELVVNATDHAGAVKNAFVYIKEGLEEYSFETPPGSVTIENKECRYVPHVTGVQVNQNVLIVNDDPTLHNVHTYSKNSKSWNLGMPVQGMKVTKKFTNPEVMVSLKCDVHPWMLGYVGVLTHPYFYVTDLNGEFELKNLPPGKYVVEVWHEKLGTQSQTVEIGPRETKEMEFRFPPSRE